MGALFGSLGFGLACGLALYLALRLLWPEIPIADFGNLIGLSALMGAAAAAVVARARARRRAERAALKEAAALSAQREEAGHASVQA